MSKRRANGEGTLRKRSDGRWEGRYTTGYNPDTGKRIISKPTWAPPMPEGYSLCFTWSW